MLSPVSRRSAAHLAGLVVALTTALVVAGCTSVDGTPSRSSNTAPAITAIAPTAIILDASDSMTSDDAPGPRIAAAKRAATGLIDALPDGSDLALLSYGTGTGTTPAEAAAGCRDVTTLVPLGPLDRAPMTAAIEAITPRGFTPIAESLRRAAALLPADSAAAIVLISDGEDTCGTPPCDVAGELKRANAQLQISTVGFRTEGAASDQLRCIADVTGGLFVEAANEAQLAARLLATQNGSAAATVNGAAFEGIDLGQSLTDIRRQHPDFPNTGIVEDDLTIVHWHDCDWAFDRSQQLVQIRPAEEVRTIDGVGAGSTVGDAQRFYGPPVATVKESDGTYTLTFDAGGDKAAYQVTASGTDGSAVITRIVVCRCLPTTAADLPSTPPTGLCSANHVTSQADYTHPRLGLMRLFTLTRGASSGDGNSCVVAVPADADRAPIVVDKMSVYKDELTLAEPVSDSTGNAFVNYNPGRYNGVLILVPTDSGFQPLTPQKFGEPSTGVRNFYGAELIGPGANGQYVIEQSSNDCAPDCAGGTITKTRYRWNGSDYVQ
ncbi:VWA domain-containing protein [Gordonia alkaliphila]|uniref:vWA domain-containing protein n=1 Tax=Gordonia alkaliphila TaxID=1053547 RepID=UPI001FF11BED|nr:VWA domain-containing protein [Gordonia alkaliphila]MCK0437934.1 VWA domain-containing protein [Gordonia alkaliphila]